MKQLQKKREDNYKDHQDKSNKALQDVKNILRTLIRSKKSLQKLKKKLQTHSEKLNKI